MEAACLVRRLGLPQGEEALRERARALGHRDLWEVGLLQVRAGMTTTGELLRVLGLWE